MTISRLDEIASQQTRPAINPRPLIWKLVTRGPVFLNQSRQVGVDGRPKGIVVKATCITSDDFDIQMSCAETKPTAYQLRVGDLI